jgi:DNA-binding transcriptional regulator YhcF (GntR family)
MTKMSFHIDSSLNSTKQAQIIDAISNAINNGDYAIGDALPSVNQLSNELNVSRDTVFKAYSELRRRGLIQSTPAKEYRVADSNNKVFMFLDSYSPFKDVLYNSFIEHLPENYQVDLGFHHYNFRVFETVILDSIGKYNVYIVMNFNNEKIADVLRKIDPNKLLILDWGDFKAERYAYVCQNFGEQASNCFRDAEPAFRKYHQLNYVYPRGSVHPQITLNYFELFCSEINKPCNKIEKINETAIRAGHAYLIFRQKDLVQILQHARSKKLAIGSEIGIIVYNDTPLYEVIDQGITSISTDFSLMGRRAASFVKSKEKIRQIIPTKLIMRNSL